MKGKPLTAVAIALTSAFVVAGMAVHPVFAVDDGGKSAPFVDKEFEAALRKHLQKRFFNLIDASDSQREQITSLLDESREAVRPQREKLKSEAIELTELMEGSSSEEQIRAKVQELRSLRDKLMDDRLTTALKVRALLKPEQRKLVSDKIVSLLNGSGRARMLR
jgi:Spy/CpxP family protein refolding chaperone